jgi:hypothetical protein
MQTVRLHADGSGALWALAKCRVCGEVHKYPAVDVVTGPTKCMSCGLEMEIRVATIAAAELSVPLDGTEPGKS